MLSIPHVWLRVVMPMPHEGGRVMDHSSHLGIRNAEIPVEDLLKGFWPIVVEDTLVSLPVGALVPSKIRGGICRPSYPGLLDKMIHATIWEMPYLYGYGLTLHRHTVQIQNIVVALGYHPV